MFQLKITTLEMYDEVNEMFIPPKSQAIQLEHSLVSISKWESKWCKPFLSKDEKTLEQTIDYIRCMTITQHVDPDIYNYITDKQFEQISEYVNAEMTATTITSQEKSTNREIITSELIYYWMIAHNIPFECQKWHLNRLLTLIAVCNIKNSPPKKMSAKELASRNRSLNEARRKALGTEG